MVANYRYAVCRKSIIEETFFVEADSWDEALEKARDGDYADTEIQTDWVDWYDDNFEAAYDFEPEPLCPLTKMVKEYDNKSVDKLDY